MVAGTRPNSIRERGSFGVTQGMNEDSASRGGERGRWMRLAAFASVGVGFTLAASKATVWLLTGSVTMLASLMDSVLDLLASLITLIGVRTALEPPDYDHRFGHSKAEGLAALAQAAIMTGSATFIFLEAIGRLISPVPVEMVWTGFAVSVLAIVLTLGLVGFQRRVIRRTGSLAIRADSLHYTGDLLLNLAVMAGLALAAFTPFERADGLFGAGIALYIARQAFTIARTAVDMLMDKEFSEDERERIFNITMGNPLVRGLHDLKTRSAGLRDFIQLHIEVDPDLSLREAHLAATEVEAAIGEAFPDAEIIINVDPVGFERPNLTVEELSRPR